MPPECTRICMVCHENKPINAFRVINGHRKHTCRNCLNAHRRKQYTRGETGPKIVARKLIREYGITIEEYEELAAYQNHVCAICKQLCKTGNRLSVDHCHTTGRIRGLLCSNCNTGIGQFNDDPELLRCAADYIEETT